ncbi:MAG TPA: hydroxyacid dehydrogenase [Candidatus Methanofastidiosa archaeon]|nr:hydroxyacid dehydrogenase [Candidatus Methanofastidiosa archaeon]HPR40985.1 hydroxyacid dehydrogenase [Candidatus Methanofastidiosa archaeon]
MKVLIASNIAEQAIEQLKANFEVEVSTGLDEDGLAEKVKNFDALVVRSKPKVSRKIIESGKNLKLVARAGVGLDNIDLKACEERGIKVINSPTALSESVAELVFAMLLSFERNIVRSDNTMKDGKWEKNSLKGIEIYEKTLGIIGFGRIGSHMAKIANGFGMKVFAFDVHKNEELAASLGVKYIEMEDLLRSSDYITLHVPLIPQTKGMISMEQLMMMKDSAILINTSRGGIVDEKDLYTALRDGNIRGACLDVFETEPPTDSPLLELDNILLTPHIGASTKEAQDKAGLIIAEKIIEEFK